MTAELFWLLMILVLVCAVLVEGSLSGIDLLRPGHSRKTGEDPKL